VPGHWEPSPAFKQRFRDALLDVFDEPSLTLLTSDFFGHARSFPNLSPAGFGKTLEFRLYELIEQARMGGWLQDLVAAAHERRPASPGLAELATERGFTVTGPRLDNGSGKPLEALIKENAKFIAAKEFFGKLPVVAAQVCFVRVGAGGGTGFLVYKNLVLTNQHVVAPLIDGRASARDVVCRFDYHEPADGTALTLLSPTDVRLADKWLVDSRPPSEKDWDPNLGDAGPEEGDYALIRLAEDLGSVPVGGATDDPHVRPRGWIQLADPAPELEKGNQIFLLQHPDGEPLQLSVGEVENFNRSGTRVRHSANSKNGSSGSPCFDSDLRLVALHHAHDPAYPPTWNQAIPLALFAPSLGTHVT
jgi:hypothetical protein